MKKEKESLIFCRGDDYGIWKKKVLGILMDKTEVFGLELEFAAWEKVNEGVVKIENPKVTYAMMQKRGLAIMWKYLDGGIIKKVGEVETVQGLFRKLDEIYQRVGGVLEYGWIGFRHLTT